MKVPLIVDSFIDEKDEKEKLIIWRNSRSEIVNPPIMPYVLMRAPLKFSFEPIQTDNVSGILLSNLLPVDVLKCSFPNTKYINSINRSIENSDQPAKMKKIIIESNIEFRERIIIDIPGYFTKYPNTDQLKPFFFDIETLSLDGRDFVQISSIAWAGHDRVIHSMQADVLFTVDGTPYVDKHEESKLIQAFFNAIKEFDPDIIAGYWMKDFDFVRIFERAKELGISYYNIARNGVVKYYTQKFGFEEKVIMQIGGRILYDIIDSVRSDQSLHGIKNHKMKTVAKWKNFPTVIEEDTANTVHISKDQIKTYNESDVNITMKLYDIYFPNIQTLSEMFNVPLDMIINGSPSFIANIFQGEGLHKIGIFSNGMNQDRHPEIFKRQKAKEESTYEAAYVDINMTGAFDKTTKVDFKGMYSAIQITVNASPDTTKIIGYEPFDKNGFKFTREDKHIIYHIPDAALKKNVVISVDNSFDGILRTKLKNIRNERWEIKQKMKATKDPEEYAKYATQQHGLKIMANIPYGYNGTKIARWGSIGVSILTVGVGRILIKETIRYIEEKYGGIDLSEYPDVADVPKKMFKVCIEIDTDGIYLNQQINIDDINNHLNEFAERMFGVKNEMELELDEYEESYFVKMKNYFLYEHGKLIIHGAAFKGQKQPGCFDIALQRLAEHVLKKHTGTNALINDILDLKNYTLKDLALRTNIKKSPDTYESGSIWSTLIRESALIGIKVRRGDQIEYIKTPDGYKLLRTINSVAEIDDKYYTNLLGDLIKDVGLGVQLASKDIEEVDEWL